MFVLMGQDVIDWEMVAVFFTAKVEAINKALTYV